MARAKDEHAPDGFELLAPRPDVFGPAGSAFLLVDDQELGGLAPELGVVASHREDRALAELRGVCLPEPLA